MNAVVAVKPLHYGIHTKQAKLHHHHQTVCCCSSTRNNEKIHGLYSGLSHFELKDHKNMEILESSSVARVNQNDIWELFRETQRNILYLNRRRLMALEEMKKTQQEKQSLLNRVELASIKQYGISPVCAEVLLLHQTRQQCGLNCCFE